MRPSLFKRLRRSIQHEFRRIVDENKRSRRKTRKPPLSSRLKHFFQKLILRPGHKKDRRRFSLRHLKHQLKSFRLLSDMRISKSSIFEQRSLVNRFRLFRIRAKDILKIVFSRDFMIIGFNSTLLFLLSFFLITFIMQIITGLSALTCDISTLINYQIIDYRIHAFDWTLTQVIIVFSTPTILALILVIVLSRMFERKKLKIKPFRFLRRLTRKQRLKDRELARIRKKEKGELRQIKIQQMSQAQIMDPPEITESVPVSKNRFRRLNWVFKLFLLWTMYHCITYFFSGMLFSVVFYRRFGYVIWYIFNSGGFNLFFTLISLTFMIVLGFVFAPQFFYSGKMYFNNLTDKIRIPFLISQVILPFIVGTIIIFAAETPRISFTMTAMSFSIVILLVAIPIRGTYFPEIHFDNKEKKIGIIWKWVIISVIFIAAILFALKSGILIDI